MTAATLTWRKSSRSGSNPYGNCVEVAVAVTCTRQFCDEAATTVRDEVELCAFCAAEHDWFAERYPLGLSIVSAPADAGEVAR